MPRFGVQSRTPQELQVWRWSEEREEEAKRSDCPDEHSKSGQQMFGRPDKSGMRVRCTLLKKPPTADGGRCDEQPGEWPAMPVEE